MAKYEKRNKYVEAWKVSDNKGRPDWVVNVIKCNNGYKVTIDNDGMTFFAFKNDYIVRYKSGIVATVPAHRFEMEYEIVKEHEGQFKPCPFCKSHRISGVTLDDDSRMFREYVCCDDCGASTTTYETKQMAVDAWNMRAYEA